MKKIIKNYFKKLFEKYLFLVHRLLYILDLNLDYKYVAKTKHGDIIFSCSNSCLRSRAKTLLTKEPETIEWIDSFQENDVLYDIGANVGVYSLYAAIKKNKVVSFEPSAYNFSLLVKNIELNNFDSYIMPFNIALNDISKIDYLFMPRQIVGGGREGASGSSFGESLDWRRNPYNPTFKQSIIGFSLDEFIKSYSDSIPFPNHIKIDVDGIENKILLGMKDTLRNSKVKSISVEIDANNKKHVNDIMLMMKEAGFSFIHKKHAVQYDTPMHPVYNYLYTRI